MENGVKQGSGSDFGDIIAKWQKTVNKVKSDDVNYYVMWYDSNNEPVVRKALIDNQIGLKFVESLKESIEGFSADSIEDYDNVDSESDIYSKLIKTVHRTFMWVHG